MSKYGIHKTLLIAIFGIHLVGCTSFRSTIMSRLPNDQIVRNSCQSARGIPVTLKIPTHVDVKIVEEYFIVQANSQTAIPKLNRPLRRVELETVYTPKVMTVDFVRPAAGTISLSSDNDGNGIVLDDAGYFESIQGKIDDKTVEELTKAIPNFKKLLGPSNPRSAASVAAKGKPTETGAWHSYDSIIAYRRFDINEPCWEQSVDDFVNEYLSECAAAINSDANAMQMEEVSTAYSNRSPNQTHALVLERHSQNRKR